MRRLAVAPLALFTLVALSGCASEPTADAAVADDAGAAVPASETGHVLLEGRFSKTHVEGQEIMRQGGSHQLEVTGWRNVLVAIDIYIEADLFLLPPGCSGPEGGCALGFPVDGTNSGENWLVPSMEEGTWGILIDLEEGEYTAAGSVYTITMDYIVA